MVPGGAAWREPSDEDLVELLALARTVAVVGLSAQASRPSHGVARHLQGHGYRIVPVNPGLSALLGEPCYPSLDAVPAEVRIDIVDVFRRPEHVPGIVEAALARGVAAIWLQLGIDHPEAVARARAAGVTVVVGRCLKVEHARLAARVVAARR